MFFNQILQLCPYIFAVISTLVTICIGYAAYRLNELHKKFDHIPGPKRTSFWTGNLNHLVEEVNQGKHLGDILLELTKKYGHTFKLFFMFRPVVFTVDKEAVKELLVTGGHSKSENVYKRASQVFGSRCLGNGLVTETDNEKWNRKRNLMNPAFKREYLIELMSQFNEGTDKFIIQLDKLADGTTPFFLNKQISGTTLDVIGKVAFGKEINSLIHDDFQFPTAIRNILGGMSMRSLRPIVQFSPTYWPYRRKIRGSVDLIRETGKKWINDRIDAINNNETVPNDILTHITKMMGENVDLDFEEIIDDFCTFFIAGQETIASATTFAVMLLGQNPDKMKKLVDEIEAVIGSKTYIDYNDLGKMDYLDMVWKETLRLYPPSIATIRTTEEDHMVGGYLVPHHTDINMGTYISARLPEFNENPLEFMPERFAPDSTIKPNIYTYYPFTLGPRICIGQQFARIEGKLILAKLLQNFDLKLDENQTYKIVLESTLKLQDGLKCILTHRSAEGNK